MENQNWDIPSFFKHSKVKSKYVFNEKKPHYLEENIYSDYDTPNYIRIMKKFTSPEYDVQDENEEKLRSVKSQKTFFLRCYLPKRKIIQEVPSNRIKDVVIMTNGLNEATNFDFYDQLGSYFASRNIASILIPTPYHLNRKVHSETEQTDYEDPLKIAVGDPLLFYYSYKRCIYEIDNLCDRIQGKIKEDEDLGFYDAYFARGENVKVRVSLFGFSLGGLKALGCFMKENNNRRKKANRRYHSCIVFNSTADPFSAAIERFKGFDRKGWTIIKNTVNDAITKGKFTANTPESELILRIFKWLYHRDLDKVLVKNLRHASKRFVMVQSAADKILPKDSKGTDKEWNITDPKHGLNKIVVAGVDHVVTLDKNWNQYLTPVVEQLMTFMQNANDTSYSHQDIREKIGQLIKETPGFKSIEKKYPYKNDIEAMDFSTALFKKLIEEIGNARKQKRFKDLYYQSKGYYPKFPELLSGLMPSKKLRNGHGYCYLKSDAELKCGAGTKYKSIGSLKANQKIRLLSMGSDTWVQVEVIHENLNDWLIGFIHSDHI